MSELSIDSLLKVAKSQGYQAEIFSQESRRTTYGKEPKTRSGQTIHSIGYGMRVLKDKRIGFAYSTFLNERLLKDAITVSKLVIPDDSYALPSNSGKPLDVSSFNKKVADWVAPMKEEIAALEMPRGVELDGAEVIYVDNVSKVASTEGIDCEEKYNGISNSLAASTKKGKQVLPSVWSTVFYRESKPDLGAQREELSERAKIMLNAKKNEKKYTEAVFTPNGIASLMGGFIQCFYGQRLFLKQTPMSESTDFGNMLSITDDNTLRNGVYSYRFDTEGMAKRPTPLVENGKVMNFLYDTYWAKKTGKKSTASGMRNYNTTPIISASNVVIDAPEEKDMRDDALVIDSMMGIHTANMTTGDFSLTPVTAWYEKDGEKQGLSNLVVSSNIVNFLKGVTASSKERRQVGNIYSGHLKVKGISVA